MKDFFLFDTVPDLNLLIWRRLSTRIVNGDSVELFTFLCLLVGVVALDSITLVFSSVKGEFASLSETLDTAVHATHIGLLICVDALVLLSVLVESKPLLTVCTLVLLHV